MQKKTLELPAQEGGKPERRGINGLTLLELSLKIASFLAMTERIYVAQYNGISRAGWQKTMTDSAAQT